MMLAPTTRPKPARDCGGADMGELLVERWFMARTTLRT
jgi:hypothetical protein